MIPPRVRKLMRSRAFWEGFTWGILHPIRNAREVFGWWWRGEL